MSSFGHQEAPRSGCKYDGQGSAISEDEELRRNSEERKRRPDERSTAYKEEVSGKGSPLTKRGMSAYPTVMQCLFHSSKRKRYRPRCKVPGVSAYGVFGRRFNTGAPGSFYCPRRFNERIKEAYVQTMDEAFLHVTNSSIPVVPDPGLRYAAFGFCGFVFGSLLLPLALAGVRKMKERFWPDGHERKAHN